MPRSSFRSPGSFSRRIRGISCRRRGRPCRRESSWPGRISGSAATAPAAPRLFVKPAFASVIEAAFKRIILDTIGVLSLLEFTAVFDRRERKLNVIFTVNTIYGEGSGSVTIG